MPLVPENVLITSGLLQLIETYGHQRKAGLVNDSCRSILSMQNNRSPSQVGLRRQISRSQLNLLDRFEISQFSIQMDMLSIRQKA